MLAAIYCEECDGRGRDRLLHADNIHTNLWACMNHGDSSDLTVWFATKLS